MNSPFSSSRYSLKPRLLLVFLCLGGSGMFTLNAQTMLQEQRVQDTQQPTTTTIPLETQVAVKKAAATFLTTLRGVLVQSMGQGISVAASVCADTAQTLTQSVAKTHGVELRRISLKARNSANIPTSREEQHLRALEKMHQNGTLTDSTVVWDIIEKNGTPHTLFIRPILLNNALCLNCHGKKSDIAPETASVLTIIGAGKPTRFSRGMKAPRFAVCVALNAGRGAI
ncbi:MAG: DUF3365 domain-containing protein [Candidatus Kapaibacterium sp.]|nr:MAG: DUF3365 domain-containing protein [Candidatus Kapabacteria bacterium]